MHYKSAQNGKIEKKEEVDLTLLKHVRGEVYLFKKKFVVSIPAVLITFTFILEKHV